MRRIVEATGGSVSAADFKTASHQLAPDRDHLPSIHGFAETQAPLAAEAQSLGLDASAIAAKAVREAISAEKGRRWLEEKRDAIEAWNRWAETNELPLAEYRMF